LLISLSTLLNKIPPFSIISTSNTNTFKIERKSIIFKEPKNVGQSKVIETQTSFTFLSLRETGKTPFLFSPTLMEPIPQLQIK
jgi:hypothetical protein